MKRPCVHIHQSVSLLIQNAAAAKGESGGLSLLPRKDISCVSSSASLRFLPLYQLTFTDATTPTMSISVLFCSDALCASLVPAHNEKN